jgi:hypothetical protein
MKYQLVSHHIWLVKYVPLIFLSAITAFLLIGWFFGKYRVKKSESVTVRDSLVTAIFGLSALVLGFTFSSACQHFNDRMAGARIQALLLENTYDLCSYLNAEDKATLRKLLLGILQSRLAFYNNIKSLDQFDDRMSDFRGQLNGFNEMMTLSISRAPLENKVFAEKLLGAQSVQLLDALKAEILNAKNHPPAIIEGFLLVLLTTGALLSGYAMAIKKEDDWFLAGIYLALIGFTLVVIFSLEIPYQLMDHTVMNCDLLRVEKVMTSSAGSN